MMEFPVISVAKDNLRGDLLILTEESYGHWYTMIFRIDPKTHTANKRWVYRREYRSGYDALEGHSSTVHSLERGWLDIDKTPKDIQLKP